VVWPGVHAWSTCVWCVCGVCGEPCFVRVVAKAEVMSAQSHARTLFLPAQNTPFTPRMLNTRTSMHDAEAGRATLGCTATRGVKARAPTRARAPNGSIWPRPQSSHRKYSQVKLKSNPGCMCKKGAVCGRH
jgi:hypothetical protein